MSFRSSEEYIKAKEARAKEIKHQTMRTFEEMDKIAYDAEHIDPDDMFIKHFIGEDPITSFDYNGKSIIEACEENGFFERHPEMREHIKVEN